VFGVQCRPSAKEKYTPLLAGGSATRLRRGGREHQPDHIEESHVEVLCRFVPESNEQSLPE
jgi:hypothetical protein